MTLYDHFTFKVLLRDHYGSLMIFRQHKLLTHCIATFKEPTDLTAFLLKYNIDYIFVYGTQIQVRYE